MRPPLLRRLSIPPAHVVGHSRGAYAGARLALEYPHLVRSLTIVSSGTLSPRVSTNEIALSKCPHPPYTRESARWIYEGYCFSPKSVTDEWIDKVYEVLQLPKYRESVRKMVDEQLATRVFLPELAKQKRETLQWLREGRLQRPTQVVFGRNDPTAAIAGAFDLFACRCRPPAQDGTSHLQRDGPFQLPRASGALQRAARRFRRPDR